MPCKILLLSCWWCVIFTINLAKQKHVREWGRDGSYVHVSMYNVRDVVVCCNTVRNVALALWLVGHLCNSKTHRPSSKPLISNPRPRFGPVDGIVQLSLGLRCSKSILQYILTTCPYSDNFEFGVFDAGSPPSHFYHVCYHCRWIRTLSVH